MDSLKNSLSAVALAITQQRIIPPQYLVAIIVVIVVVIIAVYIYVSRRNMHRAAYETYLYGFWVADDGFCEESDISSMLLFIGDPRDGRSARVHRDAYLIINNDITNQQITINYSKPTTKNKLSAYKFPAKLTFTDDDIDIPHDITMELDITKGRLRLYDGETIYGVFYKDHEVSELLRD